MKRWLAGLLLGGGVSLASCGPAEPARVAVSTDVALHVRISPPPDALPFDPRGARLSAATQQLSALVGHTVDVEIDAALAAELRADFERQLIVAIENLVRALSQFRERDAAGFASVSRELRLLRCRYRILAESSRASVRDGVLDVEQPAHAPELAETNVLLTALQERGDAIVDARWARATLETLGASDLEAYFSWLTRTRAGYGSLWELQHRVPREADALAKLEGDPHAEVIARVAMLYGKAPAYGPTRLALRKWLFSEIGWLSWRYEHEGELVQRAAEASSFRRAERALSEFLARELPEASDHERVVALHGLFPDHAPRAFPGVDRFAFGLSAIDAWLADGKRAEAAVGDRAQWIDSIVCPSVREEEGGRSRSSGCRSQWFLFALETPESRARLASVLDARDGELTANLFAALRYAPIEPTLALLRKLDPKRPAHRAAWITIAEVLIDDHRHEIVEECNARWTTDPSTRGLVLYALARSQRHDRTSADYFFRNFATRYGGPIGSDEIVQLLRVGPSTLSLLPAMWPALAKGAKVGRAIAAELPTLLPRADTPSAQVGLRALSEVIGQLCNDGANEELAAVHAALARRADDKADERIALATLLADSAPGGCAGRKRRASP